MRESTGTEIAICNSGGIRADLPIGKITMEQAFEVLPFDDVIVTMDLKGTDLLDLFEKSVGPADKGMLQVSGVRIVYDPGRPGWRQSSWEAPPLSSRRPTAYRRSTSSRRGETGSPPSAGARTSCTAKTCEPSSWNT